MWNFGEKIKLSRSKYESLIGEWNQVSVKFD